MASYPIPGTFPRWSWQSRAPIEISRRFRRGREERRAVSDLYASPPHRLTSVTRADTHRQSPDPVVDSARLCDGVAEDWRGAEGGWSVGGRSVVGGGVIASAQIEYISYVFITTAAGPPPSRYLLHLLQLHLLPESSGGVAPGGEF